MCVVPKRCNDMMNVGRLQGFDVSPSCQTKFISLAFDNLCIFLHLGYS